MSNTHPPSSSGVQRFIREFWHRGPPIRQGLEVFELQESIRLPVVRVCLAPAKDVRWISELATVAGCFNGIQPDDQLPVEVTAPGQWPATNAVEDLTTECETGVEAAGGVLLLQTFGVTAEHERWR
jgi:hypothetical protein